MGDQRAERPPSSYGSMKSDEESVIEFTENDELALPAITSQAITGVKLNCVDYPETIFTQTTQQTKPPGADVFDTRYFDDLEDVEEQDEPEDMEDYDVPDSPEPPPPVEPDGQMEEEESSQPGRLDPELCMPYLFKNMQTVLAELSPQQLRSFVSNTISGSREVNDVLDVVDCMIETRGHEEAADKAINTLEYMKLEKQAKDLLRRCIKSRIRCKLRRDVTRMFKVIREGVPQAGKQEHLRDIYVEAELSTQGHGGIDPWHEYRPYPGHPPLPLPPIYSFIMANNLFRQKNRAGQLVRVATTTGLPGSGKTVLTRMFMLDWADEMANRDFQFVIPMSFRMLKRVRKDKEKEDMSFVSILMRDLKVPKTLDCLMEPDCKLIIIMDGFDEWLHPIDWNDSRKVTNINQMAPLDAIMVNLLRGTLLPHARIWILGRRAALSQLPPNLVDLETEIQGFTTEDTEQFLRQKFRRNPELRDQVLPHYNRCHSLVKFCRLPINSWIVYHLMDSRFQYLHYGKFAPKLSEYACNYMIFETNNYLISHLRQQSNQIEWREEDRVLLKKLGKLALKLHDKNAWLFSEEDIKEAGLDVKMVTTYCGLCTEVSKEMRQGRKKYCFVHLIVQEYMAVLWIYLNFWLDGKNLLVSPHMSLGALWHKRPQPPKIFGKNEDELKPILPLIESAVAKYLASPPGHYDMMMRHFCGISHAKHLSMLTGRFCRNRNPLMKGQEDAAKLLEQKILSHPDRAAVLRVCISEMTEGEMF